MRVYRKFHRSNHKLLLVRNPRRHHLVNIVKTRARTKPRSIVFSRGTVNHHHHNNNNNNNNTDSNNNNNQNGKTQKIR